MKIDEAIKHAEDTASVCNYKTKCHKEHKQLARWLRELKELRRYVRRNERFTY